MSKQEARLVGEVFKDLFEVRLQHFYWMSDVTYVNFVVFVSPLPQHLSASYQKVTGITKLVGTTN